MIARRVFIALLGGAATGPLAASAQQPAMPVVGVLQPGSPEAYGHFMGAFRHGLAEIGYVEGKNVNIDFRWAGRVFGVPIMIAVAEHLWQGRGR
jgi:putative ABC transport system substrate-binding protein